MITNKEFVKKFQNNIFLKTANYIVNIGSISKCEKFGVNFTKKELKELENNEVNLDKFTIGDIITFMVILRNRSMAKEFQGRAKIVSKRECKYDYVHGYKYFIFPHHPLDRKNGYILEHRLVMEKKLGRKLNKNEVVHHINGIRDDNRTENLKLYVNNGAHIKDHAKARRKDKLEKAKQKENKTETLVDIDNIKKSKNCLSPDDFILTTKGYQKVKNLKTGDLFVVLNKKIIIPKMVKVDKPN